MEKIVFVMQLLSGFEDEYKKCYDEIWFEFVVLLKKVGIYDYLIFLYLDILQLFVVLKWELIYDMDDLFEYEIM